MTRNKISKKKFLTSVALRSGMSVNDITKAYDAIIAGIYDELSKGNTISLTGFGSFYLQKHKGHPVQFEGKLAIPDYIVMKFSASDVLNKRFRKDYREGRIELSND